MIRRCRRCDRRKEIRRVMKYGGDTTKRTGYFRHASICRDCAQDLLREVAAEQRTSSQWSVNGLRKAWGNERN